MISGLLLLCGVATAAASPPGSESSGTQYLLAMGLAAAGIALFLRWRRRIR